MMYFNGRNLASFNVLTDESEIFVTPEKDYTFLNVPGLNGSLVVDNNKYKNIIIPVNCIIRSEFGKNYRNLINFLLSSKGYCKLSTTQDFNHYRMACFYNSITPETWERNKSGQFTIQFECKPQRYLTLGENLSDVTESLIYNPTFLEAKPLIRFYGNGTATINGYSVIVSGRPASSYIDIDCETMTCSNGSSNLSSYVTLPNGYPVLKPGSNAISYSSDSAVQNPLKMMFRWWEL